MKKSFLDGFQSNWNDLISEERYWYTVNLKADPSWLSETWALKTIRNSVHGDYYEVLVLCIDSHKEHPLSRCFESVQKLHVLARLWSGTPIQWNAHSTKCLPKFTLKNPGFEHNIGKYFSMEINYHLKPQHIKRMNSYNFQWCDGDINK